MDRGADRTFAWGSGPGCHRHTGETSGGGGHKGKDKRAGWAPPAHPSGPLRVCALNRVRGRVPFTSGSFAFLFESQFPHLKEGMTPPASLDW